MNSKSLALAAMLLSLASFGVSAQSLPQVQQQVAQLQGQRSELSSQLTTIAAQINAATTALRKAEQQPLPEKAELEAAKAAAAAAKNAFSTDGSLNNEALLDKQLFKLKLAEQKFEKANAQLASLQQEKETLSQRETELRAQLQKLDSRISDNQQRITQLLKQEVASSERNQDVTALLSGGKSTKAAAAPQAQVQTTASANGDSEGKTWSGYVVIVNPAFDAPLDQKALKQIFLGKKKSLDGVGRVEPINAMDSSASYAMFAMNVLKMDQRELGKYWAKVLFTGKGQAPRILDNAGDIKAFVANNSNAIAYVHSSAIDSSVKGVLSF